MQDGGEIRECARGDGSATPVPAGQEVGRAIAGTPLDRRLQAALWLLLVVFSLHGVFGRSLWGGIESREGAMIADMYRHGTWVTPTINGEPFLEKPPLLHWTGLALCHLAGGVSEGLVRLPDALYGLGTLVLVYLFVTGPRGPDQPASPAASRQLAAWAAVFMCGTAIEFHEYARIVLTDMALTFMVTLSLYLFWRAWLRPAIGRWLLFLVAAAVAFYGKGLIGPALIWSAVALFLLWKRRLRLLAGLAVAYVPLLLIVVLPWVYALYRFAGAAAVKFAFWDNQIGRFFRFPDPALPYDPFRISWEPIYYYLLRLPVHLAPWTLLLVAALVSWWRRSSPFRGQVHVFFTCAVAGMFLVLHASASKVVSYALPTYPFLFMMGGIWLLYAAESAKPSWPERLCIDVTAWGSAILFSLVPVAFSVLMFMRPDLVRTGGTGATVGSLVVAGLLLAFIAAGALALRRLARSGSRVPAYGLGPAIVAVAAMGVVQVVTPVIERSRSWKPIATLAKQEAGRGRAVAFAGDLQADLGAFTFYLENRLQVLTSSDEVASYLSASEPRAVIVPIGKLRSIDAKLAGLPHTELVAGAPGTLSRSFVLLVNRSGEDATTKPKSGVVAEH